MTEAGNGIAQFRVLLVTHQLSTGPADEWEEFLQSRVRRLVCIRHPFPYKEGDRRSVLREWKDGKEVRVRRVRWPHGPDILYYARDALLNQILPILGGSRFDLAIAADCLNAASLVPWRKLGLVRKLIYYAIDYSPKRFDNPLLNRFYHLVERQACYRSDLIWDLSPRMMPARRANGVDPSRSAPVLVVPMGVRLDRIRPRDLREVERHSLVFVGHLLKKQGLQTVIGGLPSIRRRVPGVKLRIIGEGEYGPALREMVRAARLEDCVEFRGYVESHAEVEETVSRSAVGLAPYVADPDSFTNYADPGKVKLYLGCGLPVVMTRVPWLWEEVQRERAGIVVDDDSSAIEAALLRLLTGEAFFVEARKAASRLGSRYGWDEICGSALRQTLGTNEPAIRPKGVLRTAKQERPARRGSA